MKPFYRSLVMSLVLVASTSPSLAADAAKKPAAPPEMADEEGPGPGAEHHWGPCGKLQLSEEQKTQLREHEFKFQSERIDLEAKEEHARLNYRRLATDPKATYKEAQEAAEEISAASAKLISAEEKAKTEVMFKIFKPEQREDAMKCHMFMRHKEGRDHEFGRREKRGPRDERRSPRREESRG